MLGKAKRAACGKLSTLPCYRSGRAPEQESFRELYRLGELDDRKVTVDIPGARVNVTNLDGPGGQALQEMISRLDRWV